MAQRRHRGGAAGSIRCRRGYVRPSASCPARCRPTSAGWARSKACTAEGRERDCVEALSQEYRRANRAAIAVSSAFAPLIRMAILVGLTATLLLGGLAVLRGDLAVGRYSVLVFMTQRLLWPLTDVGEILDLYQRAMSRPGASWGCSTSARRPSPVRCAPPPYAAGSSSAEYAPGTVTARTGSTRSTWSSRPVSCIAVIGERGQTISGGQRQRLALTRAILRDPAVLVLDEATSAVDNETEAATQRSLAVVTADRTTLVAHRLSTVRSADRIWVLDRGGSSRPGRTTSWYWPAAPTPISGRSRPGRPVS